MMSGVWVFKNGVVRLVENPGGAGAESGRAHGSRHGPGLRRKVLVHSPTGETITSYAALERKLESVGWERYYHDPNPNPNPNPNLLQFHKPHTLHLISLPMDFTKFKSMHMYDIVVKNKNLFHVKDELVCLN